MAEMDGLKKRVELIDLRLKSAHSARERESAALMETWQQIRDRFQDQSAEIIKLRNQIADLEDSRDDLLKMVHGLLEAVEGGLDSMADETVPQIKTMAGQLLANNREEIQATQKSPNSAMLDDEADDDEPEWDFTNGRAASSSDTNFHQDLMTAIEQTIDSAPDDDYVDEIKLSTPSDAVAKSNGRATASPGIRNLVARIENAVGEEFFETPATIDHTKTTDDDDLNRDLREIEALRDELHGLRHRISAGAL